MTGECMPKSLRLRVDPVLLREARKRAKAERRTLAEYVETALREKLKRAGRKPRKSVKPAIELRGPIPPDRLRTSKPAPIPGETKRQRVARDRLFHTLLDLSGVPR
jgi:hypothetical protein